MFSRKLGDSELSYFLPSRADGVNDMYLHLGFRAPTHLVNPHRVALAWAILRARHPLLAASVVMEPGDYDSARFVHTPPSSLPSALLSAQSTILLKSAPKDALIGAYLNGPRTLSSERVSVLILASPHFAQEHKVPAGGPGVVTPPATPRPTTAEFDFASTESDGICEFDLLLCAAHFLGDGIALHTCANDLFTLLAGSFPAVPSEGSGISVANSNPSSGSDPSASLNPRASPSGDYPPLSDTALHMLLELEWSKRFSHSPSSEHLPSPEPGEERTSPLPPPLEFRLPTAAPDSIPPSPHSTFQRVAQDFAFRRAQGRLIGGHAFARVRASPSNSESDPSGSKEAEKPFPVPMSQTVTTSSMLTARDTPIPRRQCHTLVRTVAFPPTLTRRVLKRCRQEGVSVSHVLFALSNVAWGRVGGQGNGEGWKVPMMMYSALNLRPYLTPAPAPSLSLRPGDASYWFLAVGYFNVVLPAFLLPSSNDDDASNTSNTSAVKTLFHRARLSKLQCTSAAKTPFLSPYAQRMAHERGVRARRFAREDDELDSLNKSTSGSNASVNSGTSGGQKPALSKQDTPAPRPALAPLSPPRSPAGTPTGTRASTPPPSTITHGPPSLPERLLESLPDILPPKAIAPATPRPEYVPSKEPAPHATTPLSHKPPSTALLGLSLLGNLDAIYKHTSYSPLTLHTLTTGSRQRAGALLLFGYTFAGRLWVSLGWDGGAFGGEGGSETQGDGVRGEVRGIVWEGLGSEGALGDKRRQGDGDHGGKGVGVMGCEGELGRWWREVVNGVEESFGEE